VYDLIINKWGIAYNSGKRDLDLLQIIEVFGDVPYNKEYIAKFDSRFRYQTVIQWFEA